MPGRQLSGESRNMPRPTSTVRPTPCRCRPCMDHVSPSLQRGVGLLRCLRPPCRTLLPRRPKKAQKILTAPLRACVRTNPKPDDLIGIAYPHSTIPSANPHRVKRLGEMHMLPTEARVIRVLPKELIGLSRLLLHLRRQLGECGPKRLRGMGDHSPSGSSTCVIIRFVSVLFQRSRTPKLTCCRKRERSGRWRQSGAALCSALNRCPRA
jgi:hypothetical protein